MRIVSITAGAGGMFCGSCLRDNAAAAALAALGHDALLVPTYTPITTDEQDVSGRRVFLGGVNVYLQNASWLFRQLPRFVTVCSTTTRCCDGPVRSSAKPITARWAASPPPCWKAPTGGRNVKS